MIVQRRVEGGVLEDGVGNDDGILVVYFTLMVP
jgi:hypothetical protein